MSDNVTEFARKTEQEAKSEESTPKPTGSPADAATAKVGDNSRQAEAAIPYLESIEEEQAKIDKINEEAKKKAASHRQAIADKKKEMREQTGISVGAANDMLALRRTSRRVTDRVRNHDENTREDFKVLYDKLGQGMFDLDTILDEDVAS